MGRRHPELSAGPPMNVPRGRNRSQARPSVSGRCAAGNFGFSVCHPPAGAPSRHQCSSALNRSVDVHFGRKATCFGGIPLPALPEVRGAAASTSAFRVTRKLRRESTTNEFLVSLPQTSCCWEEYRHQSCAVGVCYPKRILVMRLAQRKLKRPRGIPRGRLLSSTRAACPLVPPHSDYDSLAVSG
jgi:hypothetical protein